MFPPVPQINVGRRDVISRQAWTQHGMVGNGEGIDEGLVSAVIWNETLTFRSTILIIA